MIVAGLVAILLNLAFLRSNSETVEIIVARHALQAGAVLTERTVAVVEIGDGGAVVGGLITTDAASAIYGATLARPLAAGEPIRRSDLRPDGTRSGLREYSLELDAARAAGGRIGPTDIVDVIATVDGRSFYVAATVEVVSVTTEDSTPGVGDDLIIVLGVDDRTALDIASVESVGSIALVRSTGADPPRSGPVDSSPAP
jgi:Flp pilus assembly protein CpaB